MLPLSLQGLEKAQRKGVCKFLSSPVLPLMYPKMMVEFMHGYEGVPHDVTVSKIDRFVSWLIASVDFGFPFRESNANLRGHYSKSVACELNCSLDFSIGDHHGNSPLVAKIQSQACMSPWFVRRSLGKEGGAQQGSEIKSSKHIFALGVPAQTGTPGYDRSSDCARPGQIWQLWRQDGK